MTDFGIFRPLPKPEEPPQGWDSSPRIYAVGGIDYEFFSIGDLALALNRKPVTIRQWENAGYIPVTSLRSPSVHPSKRQRIYTRPMVEGLVRIATEEGILHEARPKIRETAFAARVLKLFQELAQLPLFGARALSEESQ